MSAARVLLISGEFLRRSARERDSARQALTLMILAAVAVHQLVVDVCGQQLRGSCMSIDPIIPEQSVTPVGVTNALSQWDFPQLLKKEVTPAE